MSRSSVPSGASFTTKTERLQEAKETSDAIACLQSVRQSVRQWRLFSAQATIEQILCDLRRSEARSRGTRHFERRRSGYCRQ